MDRNLGASQVATSSTDHLSYGDLYQWGRSSDGHQLRSSGTTTNMATSSAPGHDKFIISGVSPYDWLVTQNDNLWQGINGINNPCPNGYRIPTILELNNEISEFSSQNAAGAFASLLKLPLAGYRYSSDGMFYEEGILAIYWSSTIDKNNLLIESDNIFDNLLPRSYGYSVRCIKD
jgi:uncharacterized protein (TIGR02145 family)